MTWREIEEKWKHFRAHAQNRWDRLSDEDLAHADGKRAALVGRLQERYGLAREDAEKEIDSWMRAL